jgi:hypothetical protein
MSRTKRIPIDLCKLNAHDKESVIVLQLMTACNDLATANEALGRWQGKSDEHTAYFRRGALMYFIRLQMAHLNEALKVISDLRANTILLGLVANCPHSTAELFNFLCDYAVGGKRRKEFEKHLVRVRHKITFHYDPGIIRKALQDRARRRGDDAHWMTLADDLTRVRFEVADDLINTLVSHHIWEIDPNSDVQKEADRILDFGFQIYKAFLDFCGAFIPVYVQRYALFTR